MAAFHFLRPFWLLALLPLLVMLWRLSRLRFRAGSLTRICDPELLPFLLIDRPGATHPRFGLWAIAFGGTLAIIALAGPVWERLPVPVFRNEGALVIVLDLSNAMDATDLKPSRLDRARYTITDLLRARRDGQTGLVVYAGDAFTVTPLTQDTATIASQLGALSTELSPVQGQRVDLGLQAAVRLLQQAGVRGGGHVLLITSEVDLSVALKAAGAVREAGYPLSVLGIGTEAGGPVPRGRGGLWKDAGGNILIPKLNPSALRQVAEQGGGLYLSVTSGASETDRLSAFFDTSSGRVQDSSNSHAELEQWIERGPWLVLALLPLAALAFRRGGFLCVVLAMMVFPERSDALDWRDLWSKPDRRASRQFDSQEYEEAARQFEDPAWRGAAWYRAGKYQEALQALKDVDTTEGWYNRGNTLAQLGQFAEAIAAYRKVLEKDPGHADAKHNKELLEQLMKKKQQKKQSGGSGDQQDGEKSTENESAEKEQQQGEQAKNGQDEPAPSPQQDQDKGDSSAQGSEPPPKQQEGAAEDGANGAEEQPQREESPQAGPAESEPAESGTAQTEAERSEQREAEQANEQWLRRIPDDPAGLLRRKFAWQYRQRQRLNQENEE